MDLSTFFFLVPFPVQFLCLPLLFSVTSLLTPHCLTHLNVNHLSEQRRAMLGNYSHFLVRACRGVGFGGGVALYVSILGLISKWRLLSVDLLDLEPTIIDR